MINIIGEIFGTSGYCSHTRQLANAINKLEPVKLQTNLQPGWERNVNDQEVEMIKRPESNEINLIITHPMYWQVNMTAKRNWVFLVWEGDRIPKSFINYCLDKRIEYIFVPSNHTYQAVLKTLHETPTVFGKMIPKGFSNLNDKIIPKLKIMPHGVDYKLFYSQQTKPESVANDASNALDDKERSFIKDKNADFIFLANKGFRNLEDRGGLQYLIQAYLEEFDAENVELIIKINAAYGVPTLQIIDPIVKKINKEKLPKIVFDATQYKFEELVKLYNHCDVFVSPTRAEAFNLPCLEAMACGKPVITTNYGGQTDYCSDKTGKIIGGELTEVKHEIMYEGTKWLTPSIKELRKALRDAYENKEDWKKKGQNAFVKALGESWNNTAKKIVSLK